MSETGAKTTHRLTALTEADLESPESYKRWITRHLCVHLTILGLGKYTNKDPATLEELLKKHGCSVEVEPPTKKPENPGNDAEKEDKSLYQAELKNFNDSMRAYQEHVRGTIKAEEQLQKERADGTTVSAIIETALAHLPRFATHRQRLLNRAYDTADTEVEWERERHLPTDHGRIGTVIEFPHSLDNQVPKTPGNQDS